MLNEKLKNVTEEKKVEVTIKPQADVKEDILKDALNKVNKEEATKKVTVLASRLNVRKNASETAERVGLLSSGDILVASKTPAGEWTKILEPKQGFVLSKFVADVKE